MKKSVLLAFFACFSACAARAEMVTPAMAMAAADEWAVRNERFGTGNNATNVISVCDTNAAHTVLWHQVSMAGGGCLIIAPVTEIEPVVMALDRDPGELPAAHPLRGILTLDMRKRLRFLNLYAEDASPAGGRRRLAASSSGEMADEEVAANREAVRQEWAAQQQAKWDRLRAPRTGGKTRLGAGTMQGADDGDMKEMVVLPGFESGGALTHWNQDEGIYDYYTPEHVVCGCVATAAAAMMQYFRVGEKTGQEIKKDQQDSGTTFRGSRYPTKTKGGQYDWASLPKSYGGDQDGGLTDANRELLGRVAFDAGVAVGMAWSDGGSGASEAATATAFKNYFGFKEVRCVHNPKPDQYEKLIYAQCRAGAPVGMGIGKSSGGSGHSVVAVGYGVDNDDVERVRVFLGWGGSGDGWYALPYINTKATYNGPEDLYDILDTIITMIGYENDNVVPVFGRLLPYINPPMTIGGVEYSHDKDGVFFDNIFNYGFFGARVSASGTQTDRQVEISCAGKTGSVTIGPAASKSDSCVSDGDAICKWVPDPVFFPLLNSDVALSFADAREKCIASFETETNKAVFAFSGKWGEPATDAAWNYLYWLDTEADDETKESFTNKYIVLCIPYSLGLSSESDGSPSFGVFDGRAISADANKMWSFYNGRIPDAYWTIGSAAYTNDVEGAGFPYTNVVETADGPRVVSYSYTNMVDGVEGASIEYVTGELVTNEMIRVLAVGFTNFQERASGISLTVTHNCPDNPGHADPDYGIYENVYTNGVTITISAPAFVTNAADNIEFRCAGYLLSSTNEPNVVVTNLNVTVDELTPMRNGAYTVTWLWETNAVKITTNIPNEHRGICTITPDKGDNDWYKFGDVVTFTAVGGVKGTSMHDFKSWDVSNEFGEDDEYAESGNLFMVRATHPATLKAVFGTVGTVNMGSFNLTVTNYGINDGDSVPETLVGGTVLPYDTPMKLNRVTTDAVLSTNAYTDVEGIERTCLGWQLTADDGQLLCTLYCIDPFVCLPTNFAAVCNGGNGGGLVIDDQYFDPMTGDPLEFDGLWIYEKGDTSPLSWIGVNPSAFGITNGASVTLTWLWELPEEEDADEFEIEWNDTLDNLSVGYTTNLVSAADMAAMGWSLDDVTVTAPVGWIAETSLDPDGNVVATLSLDEDELADAMDSCDLTVYPNADGTLTVEATIANGLRGFYYVLYGSNDLTTWEAVTSGDYESGTPCAQAQGTPDDPYDSVTLSIIVTSGDSAAGAKRFYKVVSGATSTPLSE